MRKAPAIAAVLVAAALAGVAGWHARDIMRPARGPAAAQTVAPAAPAPEADAPAPGAAAPQPQAAASDALPSPGQEVEQVSPADTETALERIIPRQSVGHAQGLHRRSDGLGLSSSAAFVMDAASGEITFAKNPDAVLPMASITKLMTGLLLVESRLALDETLTITDEDVDNERHSRSRLKVGTALTRAEALQLALMSSENRAAHALGRNWPGGVPAFVAAMNRKARELGMRQTRYVDPTGLSEDNRSTARDIALLVVAASRHPVLRDYSTTEAHRTVIGARLLQFNNSNRLVKSPQWEIGLQKTGYIIEAGHCVAMRARVAGRDLVMVLLDAGSGGSRNADAERLRRHMGGSAAMLEAAVPVARPVKAVAPGKSKAQRDTQHAGKPSKPQKTAAAGKGSTAKKTQVARKDKARKEARKPQGKDRRVAATFPAGRS